MNKIIREPLFHFLIAGAGIFLLYNFVNEAEKDDNQIIIDDAFIAHATEAYEAQSNQKPSADELLKSIEKEIRLDILYREALKLNLDRDDAIVKSRMEQKMQFLANDVIEMQGEPNDTELMEFYKAHKEKYLTPLTFSFYQIGFSSGDDDINKANALKVLNQNADADKEALQNYGNNLPFPYFWKNASAQQIRLDLGGELTKQMENAEVGKWLGPFKSGFGEHLVYIAERIPPGEPEFEDIRNSVLHDYKTSQKIKVQNEIYKEARVKYEILVESDQLDKQLATKIQNP